MEQTTKAGDGEGKRAHGLDHQVSLICFVSVDYDSKAEWRSHFRSIAIIESGGSGSNGSIRRKRGVNMLSNRICPIPKVRRFIKFPLSHHAGTPGRLNFKIFST